MNTSFSKTLPSLQIAWDSSSLDPFKQCPRKYQLSIILGRITGEQNVHLEFGILYHSCLEAFQKARAAGLSYFEAQKHMVRYCLGATWDFSTGRPWSTGDTYKNRYTLLRSILWQTEQYREDGMDTLLVDGRPAIELSFHYPIPVTASTGENYILCGHLDRMVNLNGSIFSQDYKTTKFDVRSDDFFQFYTPDNQMSMYSLAGRIVFKQDLQGILLDACQVQVGGSRFRRAPVLRTESQVNEWYKELTEYWLPLANDYAVRNYWPMNDTACGRYGGCQFRGICGKSPEVRHQWLLSFKERHWDPLKVRGDV